MLSLFLWIGGVNFGWICLLIIGVVLVFSLLLFRLFANVGVFVLNVCLCLCYCFIVIDCLFAAFGFVVFQRLVVLSFVDCLDAGLRLL